MDDTQGMRAAGQDTVAGRRPAREGFAVLLLAAALVPCLPARASVADLRLDGATWVEVVAAQSDGRVEPGETAQLRLRLRNRGEELLDPVTGRLAVVSPPSGVTLLADTTAWPPLASAGQPGAAADDAGDLLLSVDGALACEGPVELLLELSSGGGPSASLPVSLGVGHPQPELLPATDIGFTPGRDFNLAWNGDVYGAGWIRNSMVAPYPQFVRLGPQGELLDWPPLDLQAGSDSHGALRMEAGAGRWALVSGISGAMVASVVAADGTHVGDVTLYERATADEFLYPPDLAWDGTGWAVWWYAPALVGGSWVRDRMLYVHVTPDAVLDVGPVELGVGMEPLTARQPLAWDGDELVGLVFNAGSSALVHLTRAGALDGPPVALPISRVNQAVLASTPAGLVVASDRGLLWGLRSGGEVLWGPTLLDPPRQAASMYPRARSNVTWNGQELGVSATWTRLLPGPGDVIQYWVSFYAFTPDGRRFAASVDTEPWPLRGDSASVSSVGATWNPDRREWAVPVTWGDDPSDMASGRGLVSLQRYSASRTCPDGEPPREVSPPGSVRPLLVTKERWRQCPTCEEKWLSVLHVEDLGAEARTYGLATLQVSPVSPDALLVPAVVGDDCGLAPGDGRMSVEGDGRLRIDARADPLEGLGYGNVLGWVVNGSNAWGAGSWGHGADGSERQPLNGCVATP